MCTLSSNVFRHSAFVTIFYFLLLSILMMAVTAEAAVVFSGYSVVLASAAGKNLDWELQESKLFEGRTAYVERTSVKGVPWERLCVGFFETQKQAISLQKKMLRIYPGAWVRKTSEKNVVSIISDPDVPSAGVPTTIITRPESDLSTDKVLPISGSTLSEKQLDSLMQRAKTDFKHKKYASSGRYLNALIDAGEHKYTREALELSGLVRQRKGQKRRAVDTYEKYLKLYSDDDGSGRVRQRLVGLLTESDAPRKKIRMATKEGGGGVTTHGSLSQFYQSNRVSTDNGGTISSLSQLTTLIDLTALHETTRFDHRYQLTSDHVYDFVDNNDDSEFRFIEAYYELNYRKTGSSGRFGRQRLSISGVLKRFDGLTIGYQFNPNMRINVLAGFPVDINNKTSINEHKSFYGITFETGTFFDHWNMNLFYFDEENDGVTNSNNIGTEVRYRTKTKSLYGMVDYDFFYNEINLLRLNANMVFDHGRTAYVNAFFRQAPLLGTGNALIGRQEQSIDELKKVLNLEQIYQLAKDRTANSETLTVGGAQQVNENFQVAADITFAHTDDTVASGGVAATPEIGTDLFFSTQLVGNNLLMKSDAWIFGVRYYDTDLSSTTSFIVNARFPVTRNWRVNPRLQFDIRKLSDGRSQEKVRAIFRTDYRYLNNVRLDFEVGYDEESGESTDQLFGDNNLFFTLGYRWDF